MAAITLGGTPTKTNGNLPEVGKKAPNFTLRSTEKAEVSLEDYKGKNVVLLFQKGSTEKLENIDQSHY